MWAGVNMTITFLVIWTHPLGALPIIALDGLVIYGLVAYGQRGEALTA
jgi:hypothetical protein